MEDRQRALIAAACIFILGLSTILYFGEGITHYWVDESPGPDYVEYTRTHLQIMGFLIFLFMANLAFATLIYYLAKNC